MCYLVYISTDFEGDLSQHNCALIRFEKDFADTDPAVSDLLQYKHRWFVGSKAGCSCTFRHLLSVEPGFDKPVEWFPEEEDEIVAEPGGVVGDLPTTNASGTTMSSIGFRN